jgi:hypothetical protein
MKQDIHAASVAALRGCNAEGLMPTGACLPDSCEIGRQTAGMRTLHAIVPACALLLLCTAAAAQGRPGHHGGQSPSPEAIAACTGQAVGASVSFTGRRGQTITGTCQQVGDVLAAQPNGAPAQGAPAKGAPSN